jgi:hypothetical protein
MKTLYYINGKQVDINTYYSVSSSDYIRKHIWKSCISYYKTHPSEFEFIARFSNEKDLASSLMEAYERTDDYKEHRFFSFPDVTISGKPVFCKTKVSGNSIINLI